ncbi:uncharacterized protein LOC144078631 [Stigmatopora argus]
MSTPQLTRGDSRSGVAFHLQCPLCGNFAKSHAHQLSHIAAVHPTFLDGVGMGRLGNIVMYQSVARLFHCAECFFTTGDFNKLYQHIIGEHCVDEAAAVASGGVDGEDNGSEKERKEEGAEVKEGEEEAKEEDEGGKEADGEVEEEVGEGDGKVEGGDGKVEGGDGKVEGGDGKVEERDGKVEEKNGKVKEAVGEGNEADEQVEEEVEGDEKVEGGDGKVEEGNGKVEEAAEPVKEPNDEVEKSPEKKSILEVKKEDCPSEKSVGNTNESVFVFDGKMYRCLICGWWKSKLKGLSVNHATRKHSIPREFAIQRIKQEVPASISAPPRKRRSNGGADEEEEDGLCADLLKEEMEVTAKVVRYSSNRYVCLICGWKTKMKGFAISHVVRSHDVERPYRCKDCSATFFIPSRRQQHMRTAHRPGRFTCPFCCFRSQILAGLRRHCSRCIAREEGEGITLVLGEQEAGAVVIKEETKETRAGRKRAKRLIEEGDDEDELTF